MTDGGWLSLEDLLDSSGRPAVDQVLLVARWVTGSLAEGHGQGAVHGGLSPRTIGLELDGGSPVRASIRPPVAGDGLATRYAAPEVVRGGAPDAAADVYSCGAVLWHCLTGQAPRPGSPPPVTAPEPLAGALRAMLAETSADRPSAARAGELLAADPVASASLAGAPVTSASLADALVTGGQVAGAARSRGWAGILSVVVLLLGLSVLGWVGWQVVRDAPAGTAAPTGSNAPAASQETEGSSPDEDQTDAPSDDATTTETSLPAVAEDAVVTQQPTPDGHQDEEEEEEEEDRPRELTLPAAAELCEDGLGAPYPQVWAGNEVTSCPFSVNVRLAYLEQGDTGDNVEVVAHSPVTGRTYTMTCEDTSPVRCKGGNAAIVYFGDD